jgi:hypothetical protein
MMNEKCQVFDGTSKCNRVLKQETLGAGAVPGNKTILSPVCEEHAKRMEQTRGTHKVERYQ